MAQDTQDDEDKGPGPPSEPLRPYIVYRNPQDNVIQLAIQEAERRHLAQGKPLVAETKKNVK